MFFILICFSAVALGLRFGILIATLSFGTFSLATWFEYFDLVKVYTFSGIPLSKRFPIDKIIGTQFFFGLLSYIICFLYGYLAKKLKKEKEIKELKEELASTLVSIHEATAGLATALEQEKLMR